MKARSMFIAMPAEATNIKPLRKGWRLFEVDGNRLGPAEAEDKEHGCSDGVKMLQGIEGQPSQPAGSGVAHLVRHPAVG